MPTGSRQGCEVDRPRDSAAVLASGSGPPAGERLRLRPFVLRRRGTDLWVLLTTSGGAGGAAGAGGPLILDNRAAGLLRAVDSGARLADLPLMIADITASDVDELVAALRDVDLIDSAPAQTQAGPAERDVATQDVAVGPLLRTAIPVIGLCGTVLTVLGIGLLGRVPNGSDLAPSAVHPAIAFVVAVAIATLTGAIHEAAHVVLGRARGQGAPQVATRWGQAVATTELTHTWGWARRDQLVALGGGICVDLALLGVLAVVTASVPNWFTGLAMSVLIARVLWQGRCYRRTDGSHLLAAAFNDPFLRRDSIDTLRAGRLRTAPGRVLLWCALAILGFGIDAALVYEWLWQWIATLAGVRA
jgi:hypothetical protein